MRNSLEVIPLAGLGLVRMRGIDAVRFLQGQLSNDVAQLSAERSLLAGYHNPQGRTIAILRLVQWDADDILAILPRELAGVATSRLSKFVLRAKVKVADETDRWRVRGVVGGVPVGASALAGSASALASSAAALAGSEAPCELPSAINAQVRGDGFVYVRIGDQPPRWLLISSTDGPPPVDSGGVLDHVVGDGATWHRLDVAAGQPQVYGATTEEFVAQMLNLDVLNAIAFDKGCYTGQEVIARAHYRGRVKRRMQRFVTREASRFAPGDSGQLADGRPFKVVIAAQLGDGRCDFLAVAPLAAAERDDSASSAPARAPAPGPIFADQVALPYSLPD